MKTAIRTITPEIASEFLLLNKSNRRLSETTVNFYADQMLRGQWKLTHQGIAISEDKTRLLDGQHRLEAIVKSGISVEMLLIIGGDDEAFKCIDTGKTRNASDVLSTYNIPNSTTISAIVSKYIAIKKGKSIDGSRGVGRRNHTTNEDIFNLYQSKSEYFQNVFSESSRIYSTNRMYSSSVIGSMICYLNIELGYDLEYIISFFHKLVGLEGCSFNAINLLRTRLISDAFATRKMPTSMKIMLLRKVWAYYVSNKKIKGLKFDPAVEKPIELV